MKEKITVRKKLTTTIVTQIVTLLVAVLAARSIEVSPDIQAAIIMAGIAIAGYIQKSYNIGQGIADQGKETNGNGIAKVTISGELKKRLGNIEGSLRDLAITGYGQRDPNFITTKDQVDGGSTPPDG